MIIEKFDSFSKRMNEYASYSESTIIPKLKDMFNFVEQKNYKYSVKEGCPDWDIMKNKGYFYNLLENHRIFFFYNGEGEVIGYYADPKDESDFGFIIDCDNVKYDFKKNHSFLELLRKFPTLGF